MNAMPPPPHQQNVGIAMGNPNPLPSQAPRPQEKNPQLDLSQYPDLATALHAAKMLQDEKNKQTQQGLQAGAQAQGQPSVIQQLLQTMQQLKAQQAQQQPPRAPQGLTALLGEQAQQAGVDQLPSGLGKAYAGGGIVAFAGPDGSKVAYETPYDRLIRETREQETSDAAAAKALAAANEENAYGYLPGEGTGERLKRRMIDPVSGWVAQEQAKALAAADAMQYAPVSEATSVDYSSGPHSRGRVVPATKAPAAPAAPTASYANPSAEGRRKHETNIPVSGIQKLAAANAGAPRAPTAPAGSTAAVGEAAPEDDFTGKVQKSILEEMGINAPAQATSAVEAARRLQDIDPILAKEQERAEALRGMMAQQRDTRSPIQEMLLGMSQGHHVGGIGSLLGQGASAYKGAQQNWAKEDIANTENINKLQDAIGRAKLAGNQKLADIYTTELANAQRQKSAGIGFGTTESTKLEAVNGRLAEMGMRMKELAQRNSAADRADNNAEKERIRAEATTTLGVLNNTQKELDSLTKEGGMASKEDVARRIELQQQIANMRQAIAQTIPGLKDVFKVPLTAEQDAHVNKYLPPKK